MIPINKSLTLEKTQGIANRDDEVNEAAMLAQILRKLQLSESKMSKMLSNLVHGQKNILESLETETGPPQI